MKYGKVLPQGSINLDSWQKIYESTLSSASTSVTISSLDGNTAKEWLLIYRFVGGVNLQSTVRLRFNNDSGTNYKYLAIAATDSDISAVYGSSSGIFLANQSSTSGDLDYGTVKIYCKSGYYRTVINNYITKITSTVITRIYTFSQLWTNTADNITSLVVTSDQTDGLGVGTYICLFKKVDKT